MTDDRLVHTICFRVKRLYMSLHSLEKCMCFISMTIPHSVFFPLRELFIPQCVTFSTFLKWQLTCPLCYITHQDHILSLAEVSHSFACVLRVFCTNSYRYSLWKRKVYLIFSPFQVPWGLHVRWWKGRMNEWIWVDKWKIRRYRTLPIIKLFNSLSCYSSPNTYD